MWSRRWRSSRGVGGGVGCGAHHLQLAQLESVSLRYEIGADGERLAELDEGGAKLLAEDESLLGTARLGVAKRLGGGGEREDEGRWWRRGDGGGGERREGVEAKVA